MSIEIWAALAVGFFGSFHCIGMCGPIALALPIPRASNIKFFLGRILYNIGRVISYSIMGGIFGLLGKSLMLWGFQQSLSILLGVFILVAVLIPVKYRNYLLGVPLIQKIINPFKIKIGKLFKKTSLSSLLLIGILNGFLPCGFVYVALAGAIASGSVISGMLIMMFFGFGTIPTMFAASVFGKFVTLNFRQKLSRLTPVFAVLLAVIFILRGLNLGIPYLSPTMSHHKQMQHKSQPD